MPLSEAVGRFNRAVTNRVTRHFAGFVPGFVIVTHTGRRSGHTHETPVNVFRRPGGFTFALTYGRGDWVKNFLAAGTAQLRTRGHVHVLVRPVIVEDRDHRGMILPVRFILRVIRASEVLHADEQSLTPA